MLWPQENDLTRFYEPDHYRLGADGKPRLAAKGHPVGLFIVLALLFWIAIAFAATMLKGHDEPAPAAPATLSGSSFA